MFIFYFFLDIMQWFSSGGDESTSSKFKIQTWREKVQWNLLYRQFKNLLCHILPFDKLTDFEVNKLFWNTHKSEGAYQLDRNNCESKLLIFQPSSTSSILNLINLFSYSSKRFFVLIMYFSGADPGFSFRGGAKDNVCARTSRARTPKSDLRPGSRARFQGPLKGPGSSRGLWCSLVLSEPYF